MGPCSGKPGLTEPGEQQEHEQAVVGSTISFTEIKKGHVFKGTVA
jgi:hypothetical protein